MSQNKQSIIKQTKGQAMPDLNYLIATFSLILAKILYNS